MFWARRLEGGGKAKLPLGQLSQRKEGGLCPVCRGQLLIRIPGLGHGVPLGPGSRGPAARDPPAGEKCLESSLGTGGLMPPHFRSSFKSRWG